MMASDPLVMPIARALLDCLVVEVAKVDNPPTYVQLRTGAVVSHMIGGGQDECCEGLAWVRPDSFWPSSGTFPEQDEAGQPKGVSAWAVQLHMGVIRCMPTPGADRIVTGDEWDAITQAVMDDAAAMRRAVCCLAADSDGPVLGPNRKLNVLPGIWQPIDISGGCAGGILPVVVRGPACDCAEAGPLS